MASNNSNLTASNGKAKSNGYETKPNVGHMASRPPRKVIFGAGGSKGEPTPASTIIKK
jgi:hypothetical protein